MNKSSLFSWWIGIFIFIVVLACPVQGDWQVGDGYKMHYPQLPDPCGWDICLVHQGVADDFLCTADGPITDIHFWISWTGDDIGEVDFWNIQLYEDDNGLPGNPVWFWYGDGDVTINLWEPGGLQGWYCPSQGTWSPDDHNQIYQVNITNIQDPYFQTKDQIYWLFIQAQIPPQPELVGWKTSVDDPPEPLWGSPALWYDDLMGNWQTVDTPEYHDLAFVINSQEIAMDYGDAPDPYPTFLFDDGAYHSRYPDPNYFMGTLIDSEPDGLPDNDALGDDINGLDDEDGVSFLTPLIPGETAYIEVIASKEGYLNAWLDYSGVDEWDEPEEWIFVDEYLLAGTNQLAFDVPFDASPGVHTYARFRFDSQGGLFHHGPADDGEVEDYKVYIGEFNVDFGDAPEDAYYKYPTLFDPNGAFHYIDPQLYLGSLIDSESDGFPDLDALGDDYDNFDDEDGVTFTSPLILGQIATVDVIASKAGKLDAWIDFNLDGEWTSWLMENEKIFNDLPLNAGVNHLQFGVPVWTVMVSRILNNGGYTYTRFRFSSAGSLPPEGPAADGEVEDYKVVLQFPPVRDLGDAPDSTNNFGVPMIAYPKNQTSGVPAYFPTVFDTGFPPYNGSPGPPPYGPMHNSTSMPIIILGDNISLENGADQAVDEDPNNNLIPLRNLSDLDGADDGIILPLHLPHAMAATLEYFVTFFST
ncbi:MAG: hypothetical protein GY869_06595, partial [Planctomycetes bacterium]|nr:hypothetical protein [Planctomycetota bacterium]